ncbi:SpoIIE family protein phosphatase [Streptomyces caniscabiei]|uniref:SpoIIE family protein phosphatase n=1 Tax=Streptomyces caniscabiei TaxID=2746961 RepID=A0A927L5V0_9ACTN|nr:SpoIIE family protein phosphatase [Streptomyces caniscabiei]MBD9726616.1 SpoIIE family protein phosphatase [Streptomyces caniscabiei]MDX3514821.1 SpoIIE family protein phosphatase [Streptomyces caniscabiei]MDX3723794.1 SpoIIE family protein phosphatase [Streptomyces caniscabiei]WEO24151.1 SpoIIE family protein phosphatase [Streptomyces caniscabiei]
MIPLSVSWDDIGGLVDAHERFLAGAHVDADVRDPVLDSWKRCRSAGLEPHRLLVPFVPDLAMEDPFLRAADPVLTRLTASLAHVSMTVVLCDGQARMVQRHGGNRQLLTRLDEVNFAPGFCASEAAAGTNGVGTALAERQPVLVLGREHFADCLSPFACAGAPIRNPLSGRVEAVLDLTCLRDDGDPTMLRLVREAAHDIEAALLEQATERERALLAAYRRAARATAGPGPGPGAFPSASGPASASESDAAPGTATWPRQPERPPWPPDGEGRYAETLGRVDLAVLREKAEELIASPHRTLDEVTLSGNRVATLLRRPIMSESGETGVVVEARVLGGPHIRHTQLAPPAEAPPPHPRPHRPAPVTARRPLPAPTRTQPPAPSLSPTLTPRPATTPTPSSPTVLLRPGPRATPTPPPPHPAPYEPTPPAPDAPPETSTPDAWLLLIGEPGVGRLAVLARRRLELLHDAGVRIGTTLDVTRTAEELAEVAVPRFADFAAVDLPVSVLLGDEPEPLGPGTRLRRVALSAVHEESHLYEVGDPVRYVPSTPQARSWDTGRSVLEPVLAEAGGWLAQDPARLERALAAGIHSLITVPLRARGATLGVVSFYRSEQPAPFEDDDLSLAQELVGRAAICIDNARRYTREHNTALALQRSLLPRGRPEQSAVDVAYRYLPAQAGVGGDWFDVIPLSGARVALVVGDVVGHGLHAAATMGRLRTAVHNFCALDLPPDELLTHLDDLVGRLDRGEGWAVENTHEDSGIVGATCLYAVYDPVSRHCALTRAGHPLPAVVAPDGTVEFVDLPSGPPLGLGGMPFETIELELAEGSQLVLYTDGLVEDRHRDIDTGLDMLRTVLARPDRAPEDTCEAVLDALLPARPCDDVALLVARTNTLGPERVAQWDLPSDPAVVSRAREAVTGQLAAWGLDELAFTTELVASELVTNAIRHATGPVQLRLLRDRALICEVYDGSGTSPRLRRARTEDEGGRGLFLVAQLTERWGTRYTPDGKTIWTEQPLPGP